MPLSILVRHASALISQQSPTCPWQISDGLTLPDPGKCVCVCMRAQLLAFLFEAQQLLQFCYPPSWSSLKGTVVSLDHVQLPSSYPLRHL
eukprot:363348-Chlamydomonas_euryale.AAC.1